MEDEDMLGDEMSPEMAALAANYPELAGKKASDMQQAFLPMYLGAVESERAARERAAASQAAQFKAAEEAIKQQRFGAPTTSQQLAALSQALLSPRRQRGIAGTFANLAPVFGQMATLQTGAEEKRAEALRQLRQQYATAADLAAVSGAEAKREAFGKVLPLMKQPSGSGRFAVSANPVTGVQTFKNFDVPVAAVNALLYALQTPGATEQQKADTIAAFEREFRVPAATFMEGLR